MKILETSPLFDATFYRKATARRILLRPAHHFHHVGWKQGLDPSPHFSVSFYLRSYPDVARAGINPLLHYLSDGWKEGRRPNPFFDQRWFLDDHPELKGSDRAPAELCLEHHGVLKWPLNAVANADTWIDGGAILSLGQRRVWRSMFDENYYRSTYSDLVGLPSDQFNHFIAHGWREDRNPRAGFDMALYKRVVREMHPDAHPMRDLRRLGAAAMAARSAVMLLENEPDKGKPASSLRLGVHFHAFYPEIIGEFLPSVHFFPKDTIFVVTTCRVADTAFIERLVQHEFAGTDIPGRFAVRTVENRGRDIGPFLIGSRDLWSQVDLVLHLHSKVSPHIDWGGDWRSYLFDQLFGSKDVLGGIVRAFSADPKLGMLYPENFYQIKKFVQKRDNHPRVRAFMDDLPGFMPFLLDEDFAAGSMAWFRTSAFKDLLAKVTSLDEFEIENGQLDFTLAHVLERALPIAARAAGYAVKSFATPLRLLRPTMAMPFGRDADGDQSGDRWRRDTPAIARHAPSPLASLNRLYNPEQLVLHWIVPEFAQGAGGHMTLFRMVRYLEQFGHIQTIWLQNPDQGRGPRAAHHAIRSWYQQVSDRVMVRHLPDDVRCISGDAVIATDCWTVYPAAQVTNVKERFYFIQDHEADFHPAGELQLTALATYRMGFAALCAGPWLLERARNYGMWARAWPLCADQSIYFPAKCPRKAGKRLKIAFYCRPYTPRRAAHLGLVALEVLHRQGVDFEAHLFGENGLNLDLPYPHVMHGVLTPAQLGELYRESDIGVVFSTTNYSLIPLEMMACGLPLVELDVPSTRAVFTDEVATLVRPDPTSIAQTIADLWANPAKRARQIEAGFAFTRDLDWEESARLVEAGLRDRLTEIGAVPVAPHEICRPHLAKPRKASVFIPTLNAEPQFTDLLQRLDEQETDFDFDVLVIDSGSKDDTAELVRKRKSGRFRLHEIPKSRFQHGRTRNLGIEMTDGEYVAILTQDALPADRHWLRNLIGGFARSSRVAGVIGRHHAYPEHGAFAQRDLKQMFDRLGLLSDTYSIENGLPSFILPGSTHWQMLMQFYSDNNSAMSREVWKILPYPEVAWGEDQIWAWEALKLGFEKVYVDDAAVFHSHDFDFKQQYEVSSTEGRFWAEHFGITLAGDVDASVAAVNAHDEGFGKKAGLDAKAIGRRLEANRATMTGRHAGALEASKAFLSPADRSRTG